MKDKRRTPRRSGHAGPAGAKRALPRVLCIVGPTSSGKTLLGIRLASRFDGEIINADARQIYQAFDIGTGKPIGGRRTAVGGRKMYVFEGVPHYLMDFLPPTKGMTVAEWQERALFAVKGITARKKLPIVVGGTGLYIQALVDNYKIPQVPPQPEFRRAMETKTLAELVQLLVRVDPNAKEKIDLKNPRRVLRALEVATFTGKPFTEQQESNEPVIDAYLIAIRRDRDELRARIDAAVEMYVEAGWIDEIRKVRALGIPWDAPAMTSIGYRELGAYVRGECTLDEAVSKTKNATWQYAKRQITWFKRDKRIHWVASEDDAEELARKWLRKRRK